MPEHIDTQLQEMGQILSVPSEFVSNIAEVAGEHIVLDGWQGLITDTEHTWNQFLKARQIGYSFALAARGWSRSYLSPPGSYTMIFISWNLGDAMEKMRFVDALDMSFPEHERMRRIIDNKMELEFANGNRIISAFRPIGKGKAELGIDEMVHMIDARAIQRDCIPIVTRGGIVLNGSSPLAKSGAFHDIWTGAEGKFSKYKRYRLPWWASTALVRDPAEVVRAGLAVIERMPTVERVERFASPKLLEVFDNMFLEDFQSQYECMWIDESRAFLKWDLILRCSPDTDGGIPVAQEIEDLGLFKGELFAGMDIGRRKNASEIIVGERVGRSNKIEARLLLTLEDREFQFQKEVAARILRNPRIASFVVDETGLGMQLAEELQATFGSRVVAQNLNVATKPSIATNIRYFMERGDFVFMPDREMRQQFYSIKRLVTASANVVYDTDRNEKHHADKFWAAALMLWGVQKNTGDRGLSVFVAEMDDEDDEIGRKEIKFEKLGPKSFGL